MSVEKAQMRARKKANASPIEQLLKQPPSELVRMAGCESFYDAALLLGGNELAYEIEQMSKAGFLNYSGWQVFLPVAPCVWDAIGSINWLFYDFRLKSVRVSCAFPQNYLRIRTMADLYCSLAAKLLLLRLNAVPFGDSVLSDNLIPADGISASQFMGLLALQDSLKSPQRCAALRTGCELMDSLALRRCLSSRFSFHDLLVYNTAAVVEQFLLLPRRFELVGFVKMPLCDFHRRFTYLPAFPSQSYQVLAQLRLQFTLSSAAGPLSLAQVYELQSSIMGYDCCLERPQPSPFDVRLVGGQLRSVCATVQGMDFRLYFRNVKAEARFAAALRKAQRIARRLAAGVQGNGFADYSNESLGELLQLIASLVDRANFCWNRVLLEDLAYM